MVPKRAHEQPSRGAKMTQNRSQEGPGTESGSVRVLRDFGVNFGSHFGHHFWIKNHQKSMHKTVPKKYTKILQKWTSKMESEIDQKCMKLLIRSITLRIHANP